MQNYAFLIQLYFIWITYAKRLHIFPYSSARDTIWYVNLFICRGLDRSWLWFRLQFRALPCFASNFSISGVFPFKPSFSFFCVYSLKSCDPKEKVSGWFTHWMWLLLQYAATDRPEFLRSRLSLRIWMFLPLPAPYQSLLQKLQTELHTRLVMHPSQELCPADSHEGSTLIWVETYM